MSATSTARIGLFGIGLAAYWPQFPHLKAATERHLGDVGARIGQWADVVLAGIVDTAQAGVAAGEKFAEARVDLVVCYSSVYATSTQVMPVVQRAGVPVLILNLQPEIALDYETAGTAVCLENSGICPVPEMAGVFARSGIPFRVVTGHLHGDEVAWSQVESWCRAAGAAKALKQGRFGMLGHTYPGMIDMSTDLGVVAGQLGAHVEVLEIDDLKERVRGVTDDAITVARQGVELLLRPESDISPEGLLNATRIAAGIARLVSDFELDGLAYYYRGTGGDEIERLASNMIIGNTLLTTAGIPAAGEGDLKTALAMKLMHELGAGGSFSEFTGMDFNDGFFLLGHDGPAHLGISDGNATMKELAVFHGKAGGGVAVEMRAKTGPVTILGMTQSADGRLKLVGAEGESLPGPVPRIGNSQHRVRFGDDMRRWFDAWCATGPTHHVALGLGHRLDDVAKAAWLLGIELEHVPA